MKLLTEVEPESKVVVRRIEGGSEVEAWLKDLGVSPGVELTLIAAEPVHAHVGPISLKVAGKEIVISQGWADKVLVEKGGEALPLLRLEKGDEGVVKAIEGGKDFKDWISQMCLNEGSKVEFLSHLPHETLILKVEDKEVRMGPGKASRVWVEDEGKIVQVNYLKEGKKARVAKLIGGTRYSQEMKEMGIKEGIEITLVKKEVSKAPPQRKGNYVLAELEGQIITIGRGMAEKIWVE